MSTPTTTCPTILRDGPCAMPNDHRGRHTTVAFWCDLCGKYRRGQGIVIARDYNGDECASGCWFCINVLEPRAVWA